MLCLKEGSAENMVLTDDESDTPLPRVPPGSDDSDETLNEERWEEWKTRYANRRRAIYHMLISECEESDQ
jgi:hypothetical protein